MMGGKQNENSLAGIFFPDKSGWRDSLKRVVQLSLRHCGGKTIEYLVKKLPLAFRAGYHKRIQLQSQFQT